MLLNKRLAAVSFATIIITSLLSLLAFFYSWINIAALLLIIIATVILTWKNSAYGLLLILAELFIGSQGHLFTWHGVSLRMVLFATVIFVWLIKKIKCRDLFFLKNNLLYYYLVFFIFLIIGIVQGIALKYQNWFFDANAWAMFALIFIFLDLTKPKEFLESALSVLFAGSLFLSLETIGLFVSFGFGLDLLGGPLYLWLRDFRIAEITYIGQNLFRIFIQSQIYLVIAFLFFLTLVILNWKKNSRKIKWLCSIYLYLISLAIIISQSRSFWLGFLSASCLLLVSMIIFKIIKLRWAIVVGLILLFVFYSQLLIIQIATGSAQNLVGQRVDGLQGQSANLSRVSQLSPLINSISQRAILGYGFGKELTYISNDPRVLEISPSGVYTTYAFEWGYLDIALKIGVLGLLVYLGLLWQNFKLIFLNIKKQPIVLGLLAGFIGLLIINIFSPYLNHPLGIGYVLLLSLISDRASN